MKALWQKICDWFSSLGKKVKVDATIKPDVKPAVDTACKCKLTGQLIDPDPARYTPAYMSEPNNPAQARYEEVGSAQRQFIPMEVNKLNEWNKLYQ